MMYKINSDKTSRKGEFDKTTYVHKSNTRQSSFEGFSLQSISTNFKKNFVTFDGIKFWNSLPIEKKKMDNKTPLCEADEIFSYEQNLKSVGLSTL